MADKKNEYRIPINIELGTSLTGALDQVQEPSLEGLEAVDIPQQIEPARSSFLEALNAGFLIDSTKKVLSATGNTSLSNAIDVGMTFGTAIAGAATGSPGAMLALIMDLVAQGLTQLQEIKAEAMQSNNVKINNIRIGKTLLGSGRVETTKDHFGNIKYYTN